MQLTNLDTTTRRYMREEVDEDIKSGALYISPRLSTQGAQEYPALLIQAVDSGTPESLSMELNRSGRLNEYETSHRQGNPYTKKVPVNAAETLAEGEFNRFYARGLCRRAEAESIEHLSVYRAKPVMNPRPESEEMLGRLLPINALLTDLRTHIGVDTALGLPPGPNSGLSVEIPS